MNTKTLLPAPLIVHLVIAACVANHDESGKNQGGRSMPSARDVGLSFGFDCVAWQANAQFAGRAPGTVGAWIATGTELRGCMNFR